MSYHGFSWADEGRDMLRVAIVDDDASDAERVVELLKRHFDGDASRYAVTCLSDGEDLISDYRPSFDLVFLDIEMERMGGLECARRLRALDREVMLVFTTNLAQYASFGYDVDAIGYLVKPLRFYSFELAMRRVEDVLARRRGVVLWLADGEGKAAVASRDVLYVEVRKHELEFHAKGGTYTAWGSLKEYAERLVPAHFAACSRYYLVNLEHVHGMGGDLVRMDNGDELPVSRRSKKVLMQALADYYGTR